MRKIITLKTIFTTILLSSINCGNYNQIRKVNKLAFNSNEQFVHEISRIRKIENNLIQIFVHTSTSTNSYPKINFEEKCFYLKLEENNKNQFYHYNVDKIYLMDECDFEFISRLFFSSISKERFETYKNNLKDEVIRLKFFNSLKPIYYEIEIEERNIKQNPVFKINTSTKQETNSTFALLFPIAITYDLLAGTLHTIGKPFRYLTLFNGILENNTLPAYRRAINFTLIGIYKTFSYLDEQ